MGGICLHVYQEADPQEILIYQIMAGMRRIHKSTKHIRYLWLLGKNEIVGKITTSYSCAYGFGFSGHYFVLVSTEKTSVCYDLQKEA